MPPENHGSAAPRKEVEQLGVLTPGHLLGVGVVDRRGLMQVGRVAIVERVGCIMLPDHLDGLRRE